MATLAIISTVASIIGIIGVVTGVAVKGTLAVSAFNSLNDLVDVKDLNNIKGFDEGFTDITIQSMDLLVYMMQYMSKLIILFSFLCIIINSFKLWAGTTEIKKSFIDILYKSVMVILLTFFYPKAVVATYTWATEIGIKASGGSELLTNCFSALAANTSSALQNTTNVFLEKLKTNGGASEGDNYIISEGTLKVFEELGLSEDEAKKWASQNGLTIITGKSNLLTRKQKNAEKAAKKKLTTKETNKRLKQDLEIIRSLNEVLSGIDENGEEIEKLDAVTLMNMNNDSLKSVFFNPYIKGSNDRISISAMMKTAIIISEIVSSGCLGPY